MDDLPVLESVAERDVDLLLLEEVHVTPAFRDWLIKTATGKEVGPGCFLGAWHSIVDASLGESDIVVLFRTDAGERHAVLIENKIAAPFQRAQPERYKARGEQGIGKRWDRYTTCLVAPKGYHDLMRGIALFDGSISLEGISVALESTVSDTVRAKYRTDLLAAAIERHRRGWQLIPDATTTQLWADYYEYARRHFPQLGMDRPRPRPALSDWVYLKPKTLPKLNRLVHKMPRGYVDLEFAGMAGRVDELTTLAGPLLPPGAVVTRAGKSAAIRHPVPVINLAVTFAGQQAEFAAALQAADALHRLAGLIQLKTDAKST